MPWKPAIHQTVWAMMRSCLAALGAIACSTPAGPAPGGAPVGQVVTTERVTNVAAGPGAEHCAALPRAQQLASQGALADAEMELIVMLEAFADFERQRGAPLVAFANQAEYEHYSATSGRGRSFAPVDWCYRELHQLRAFIHASREHYAEALRSLDRAAEVGPTAAASHVERGYVLNRLGRYEQARDSYRRALELASEYPASQPQRPMALRGLGFALIELGELDAAERAFVESLEYEPDNALARNELGYIERLRQDRR